MEQFFYYLRVSWVAIKRAPLPYALTIFIMSLGIGVFFSTATFYYWIQYDPMPHKSDKLFFPRIANMPYDCGQCEPSTVLSYRDVKNLGSSGIPVAMSAMFGGSGYVRFDANTPPIATTIRFTQRDFFRMFDVPVIKGQIWADNNARMEIIISRAFAEKIFARIDVVGESIVLDDRTYSVVAVLDHWAMVPRLYDAGEGGYLSSADDVYLPLEIAYDLGYKSDSQVSTYELVNINKLATEGREKAFNQLQFWVELDTPEQHVAYKSFMKNLVIDEKKAGRHPSNDLSLLHPMSGILDGFHVKAAEIKAYALVSFLFLIVCFFNASHLSLNRYIANQYEFSLRRALGASSAELQKQLLVDVFISSTFSIVFATIIAWLGIALISHFLPENAGLAKWNGLLMWGIFALTIFANYLVTLYPAIIASFGNLNTQLKS